MTDFFGLNQDLIDKRKANERVEKKIGKIERVKESKVNSLSIRQEQQDTSRTISRFQLEKQKKQRYNEIDRKNEIREREANVLSYVRKEKERIKEKNSVPNKISRLKNKIESIASPVAERIGKGAQKIGKSLYKSMKKPLKYKTIMKKSKMTYKPREYIPDNTWNHENKFFKNEIDNEKRSLYFS